MTGRTPQYYSQCCRQPAWLQLPSLWNARQHFYLRHEHDTPLRVNSEPQSPCTSWNQQETLDYVYLMFPLLLACLSTSAQKKSSKYFGYYKNCFPYQVCRTQKFKFLNLFLNARLYGEQIFVFIFLVQWNRNI
jgi:hypothetical protein